MINTRFEAYKIKRELIRSGIEVVLRRPRLNQFKEPSNEYEYVGKLKGLYHELSGSVAGYVKITTGDTTQVRSKKDPMLLCLYEDVKRLKLRVGDQIKINAKMFKVTGVVNVQEWNIIADVSLEVVDCGVPA